MTVTLGFRMLAIGLVLSLGQAAPSAAEGFWRNYKAAFGNAFLGRPEPAFQQHRADRILTYAARGSAAIGATAAVAAGGIAAAPIVAAKAPAVITGGALLIGSAGQRLPMQFPQGAGAFARGPTAAKVAEAAPRVIQAISGR